MSGQNEMSNQAGGAANDDSAPGQIGYTSLIILLFFLFTIFGLLTAFLIKHKPRRKVPVGRSAKVDIENPLDAERSSRDLNQDEPSEVATFDFLDSYEASKQPVIRFSDPKGPFDSYESVPIKGVREKLLEDYLQQPASEDLSYTSPDSLKTDDQADTNPPADSVDKLLDDDSSVNTQSPQFQEISKELIIANVEPVQKEEDTQTEPFPSAEEPKRSEHDTFSAAYNLSVDEENLADLDKLEDELKLGEERSIDKKIDDLLDGKFEAKFNGMPGESEELKLKNEDIPEYATFPDGSHSGKSDRESIKSTKSTKSYHSYGFPHEDYPSDPVQPEFKLEDEQNSNPTARWRKLYENQKLEKPSDYNELMKSLNSPSAQRIEDEKECPKKADKELEESEEQGLGERKSEENELGEKEATEKEPQDNDQPETTEKEPDVLGKDDGHLKEIKGVELVAKSKEALKENKKSGKSKSNDSSLNYEYKVIVCPPLDENDPNAKYVQTKDDEDQSPASPSDTNATSASTSASTSAKEIFSPEDTNPDRLIKELLNESENSSLQSERFTSSASEPMTQQVRETPSDKATSALKKADKFDESGSLKTLNSVDEPLTDYSIPKRPSELQTNVAKASPKAEAKIESKQVKNASNRLSPLSGQTQFKPQANQLQTKPLQANQLQSKPPQSNQLQTKPQQSKPQQSKPQASAGPQANQQARTSKSVLDVLEKRKKML